MVLALTELVTAATKTYGGDEEAGGRESVEVRGSPLLQEVIDLGPFRADQQSLPELMGDVCCPSFENGSLQALNPSLGHLWK